MRSRLFSRGGSVQQFSVAGRTTVRQSVKPVNTGVNNSPMAEVAIPMVSGTIVERWNYSILSDIIG